jgi:hypothetical protein
MRVPVAPAQADRRGRDRVRQPRAADHTFVERLGTPLPAWVHRLTGGLTPVACPAATPAYLVHRVPRTGCAKRLSY